MQEYGIPWKRGINGTCVKFKFIVIHNTANHDLPANGDIFYSVHTDRWIRVCFAMRIPSNDGSSSFHGSVIEAARPEYCSDKEPSVNKVGTTKIYHRRNSHLTKIPHFVTFLPTRHTDMYKHIHNMIHPILSPSIQCRFYPYPYPYICEICTIIRALSLVLITSLYRWPFRADFRYIL